MSQPARDIVGALCNTDVSKRLGNIEGGAATVKAHPWFHGIDWDAMYERRRQGPIVPHLRGPADTKNFDDYDPEPEGREKYSDEMREKWDEMFRNF